MYGIMVGMNVGMIAIGANGIIGIACMVVDIGVNGVVIGLATVLGD